jgi:2-(1,2-epoxy-1,2-dihydrophenyl)acetyl-CoA isomerase
MTELIETIDNGVATLTMNRPDALNALSDAMMDAFASALPRLAADREVGCVVVTGAGRGFCAGGDVKRMARDQEFSGTMEERVQELRDRMEISRLLHEMPKPTIAAVRGPAAGAGLSLALACDMRIASESARFITAFARVGY